MREAHWRLWRVLPVAFALVLVAASCGDDGTTTGGRTTPPATTASPSPSPEPEPAFEGAALTIWADETRSPVLRDFAHRFTAETGAEVTIEEVEFGMIRDNLLQSGPVGEGPDIIIGAHDWLGALVEGGVVEPLDLAGRESEFLEVGIQAFTYNGQLYGLPYAVENVALVRNTDLVPDAPATFEELSDIALGLQEDGTVDIGLAIQVPDPYHQYPLFTGAGGYVFGENDDGTYNPDDLGIDSEGGLAAGDKFTEWTQSGLIDPDVTYDVMLNSFGDGNAAFAITGPWAVTQEDPPGFQPKGVPYVVEPIPPIDGNTPRVFVGVQGFMISSFSENKLAAQTFVVDFMAGEDVQLALYAAGGRPPAHAAAFETASEDADIQGFGLAGQDGDPLPAIPEMGSVWTAWTDAYSLIFNGESEGRAAFTTAAEQIRNLIEG